MSRNRWGQSASDVETWVPAGVAYMVLGDELARRLACDPQEGRHSAAIEILLLLAAGQLRARAGDCSFDLARAVEYWRQDHVREQQVPAEDLEREGLTPELWADSMLWGEHHKYAGAAVIPAEFWAFLDEAPEPIEWATSKFYWRGTAAGMVADVEFALDDLPCIEAVRAFLGTTAPAGGADQADAAPAARQRKGGRPSGPAWPAFCAELVAYLSDHPDAVEAGNVAQIARAVIERQAQRVPVEQENSHVLGESLAQQAVRATLSRLADRGAS